MGQIWVAVAEGRDVGRRPLSLSVPGSHRDSVTKVPLSLPQSLALAGSFTELTAQRQRSQRRTDGVA